MLVYSTKKGVKYNFFPDVLMSEKTYLLLTPNFPEDVGYRRSFRTMRCSLPVFHCMRGGVREEKA